MLSSPPLSAPSAKRTREPARPEAEALAKKARQDAEEMDKPPTPIASIDGDTTQNVRAPKEVDLLHDDSGINDRRTNDYY
ncbi:hypothetical protein K4K49_005747 [Colletotrichum sp. SAR 10_70]|nr:hypothetical protein K4K50_013254 [Colletotrichum sp. SAR 10_71]KAI8165781.1 hypothetical protein K4K49_005747 [Colletotrichum sp. SAR 10_70]